MSVTEATDDTFDALVAHGIVLVSFYNPTQRGWWPDKPDTRTALEHAAAACGIPLVMVNTQQSIKMRYFSTTTIRIYSDGKVLAVKGGEIEGGHPDSYRYAYADYERWIIEKYPSAK